MESPSLTIESRDAFLFAACCAHIETLAPGPDGTLVVLRPRDPDCSLIPLAKNNGSFRFSTPSLNSTIRFRVEVSEPLPTDTKPERYKELILECDEDRETLLAFVSDALAHHRARVTEPRGMRGNAGVMRFSWDESTQCWDVGKFVPKRPMDTLFLPDHLGNDVLSDLAQYLKPETKDLYAALHVSPIRVYMLHGTPGSGKTSCIHCLASETNHNLAVFTFDANTTDDDLKAALRSLPASCFLCLEDVDTAFERRMNRGHGVNFASFLAAMDGMYTTSQPLTVFLTTNCYDSLDLALKRRVDLVVTFGHATRSQCRRMFEAFFPNPVSPHCSFDVIWTRIKKFQFSMSVFQKFLVRALPFKDLVGSLHVFEDMVHSTYGQDNPNAPSMFA